MDMAIRENENFIRIPYEFFHRGLTAVARLVLAKIFTFSRIPNVESECRSSFRKFADDFRICSSDLFNSLTISGSPNARSRVRSKS